MYELCDVHQGYTSLLTPSLAVELPVPSCSISRWMRRAAFSALMRSSSWRTAAWLVGMLLLRAVLSSEGNIRSLYWEDGWLEGYTTRPETS